MTGIASPTHSAPTRSRALARDLVFTVLRGLERWAAPVADLALRLTLFRVFFFSGLQKLGDWPATLQLFEYEYQVPLLPPGVAATLAAGFELGASSLLLIGLATRLAALPLLGMALVIQFVLGAADPAYNAVEHYLWMAGLLSLITRGPGALSLDAPLRRRFAGRAL